MSHTIEIKASVTIDGKTVAEDAFTATDGDPYLLADSLLGGVRQSVGEKVRFPSKFDQAAK